MLDDVTSMRMILRKIVATAMTNAGVIKIVVMITKTYVKMQKMKWLPGNYFTVDLHVISQWKTLCKF